MMGKLEQQHELWWPMGDRLEVRSRKGRLTNSRQTVDAIVAKAKTRGTCVQAGGHIGLWPLHLAQHFTTVYTFEPHCDNFRCLVRNVSACNVYPVRGVLGCDSGGVTITRDRPYSGVHYVKPQVRGPVPTFRIDDLSVSDLSAIVLDVEGFELPALRGAEASIRAHRPLIVLEDLNLGDRLGYGTMQDIETWLASLGYGAPQTLHKNDIYFL